MTHPIEQLAGAVDGSLGPADRTALEEHLRSCSSCREELRLAAAAHRALRAMPEPTAPDLAGRFTPDRIDALTAPVPARGFPASRVVPALAAAAIVALVALVVPRIDDSPDGANIAAAPAAPELTIDGPVRLQIDDTDYDADALDETAAELTASLRGSAADTAGPAEVATEDEPASASGPRIAPGSTREAVACLRQAFPGFPGQIVQVRRATFEGEPAFLGIVLESAREIPPGGGLSIWVAAVADCSILSVTSKPL